MREDAMEVFAGYLAGIEDPRQRARSAQVLGWVGQTFPGLAPRIAWNQPMFTDHGTFIIGFSVARHHLAVGPEKMAIGLFSEDIRRAGYDHSQQLIRIRWDSAVDFGLLKDIIEFNILDKADCANFWRK